MNSPPISEPFLDANGKPTKSWIAWFNDVQMLMPDSVGTTAQRPTKGLYVGKQYFDTTLHKPLWLKSVKPTVWVLATGVAA